MTLSNLNQQSERCDSFLPCLLQQLSQGKPHRVNQKKSVLVSYPAVCKQLPQGRPHGVKQERKNCASFLPCLMQQFPQGRQYRLKKEEKRRENRSMLVSYAASYNSFLKGDNIFFFKEEKKRSMLVSYPASCNSFLNGDNTECVF